MCLNNNIIDVFGVANKCISCNNCSHTGWSKNRGNNARDFTTWIKGCVSKYEFVQNLDF